LAQQLGIDFTPEHNEQLKGVSRVRSLEIILALGNIAASQEDKEIWLKQKNNEYLSYLVTMDESEVLPGVLPVLAFLKEKNQKIVLGSASKNARPILEKAKVIDYFDAVVDGNDVSNAKPDPEVFLQGAKKVNLSPEKCIVFEDSVAGIQAANIGGMTSIGIGDETVLNEADYVFPDFTHIDLNFIENLVNK
jgi:beta-phosphoglucomutase